MQIDLLVVDGCFFGVVLQNSKVDILRYICSDHGAVQFLDIEGCQLVTILAKIDLLESLDNVRGRKCNVAASPLYNWLEIHPQPWIRSPSSANGNEPRRQCIFVDFVQLPGSRGSKSTTNPFASDAMP